MRFCFALMSLLMLFLLMVASCLETAGRPHTTGPVVPEQASLPRLVDMPTDNSMCIVCHMDFDDEEITNAHIWEGITCAYCHGTSVAHMHDETMMTSPDILYGRTEVEGLCLLCHKPHKNPSAVEDFRQKWAGKKRENGRGVNSESVCTDCHGLHTIARR